MFFTLNLYLSNYLKYLVCNILLVYFSSTKTKITKKMRFFYRFELVSKNKPLWSLLLSLIPLISSNQRLVDQKTRFLSQTSTLLTNIILIQIQNGTSLYTCIISFFGFITHTYISSFFCNLHISLHATKFTTSSTASKF